MLFPPVAKRCTKGPMKNDEGKGINIDCFPATNIAEQFANINIAAECNRSYLWR
jgi:hypothetical protein